MSLTSALSITASVNPPRAVFVDYPLGHTAGKPDDVESQDAIVRAALDQLTFGVAYTAVFYIVHGLIGGKTIADAVKAMKLQIWPCTRASCGYWIPATWLALSVRPELQLPCFNVCGVFWTILQSILQKKVEEAEASRRANTRWHVAAAALKVPGMLPSR